MEFTGERYVPELDHPHISYEHWHRYLLAGLLVCGKTVLDVACGEGYGSYYLALQAQEVTGVDVSAETILHASSRYTRQNLSFHVGSAAELPAHWTGHFDAVVSFETIEHIPAETQESFLHEVKRVLKPDGLLIVSTPNKLTYSDLAETTNEYHTREFYLNEFRDTLGSHFDHVRTLGQKVYPVSYMWDISDSISDLAEFRLAMSDAGFRPTQEPKSVLYAIAVCSAREITIPSASILVDVSEQLTKLMQERERIAAEATAHAGDLRHLVAEKERALEAATRSASELKKLALHQDAAVERTAAHIAHLLSLADSALHERHVPVHDPDDERRVDLEMREITGLIEDMDAGVVDLIGRWRKREEASRNLSDVSRQLEQSVQHLSAQVREKEQEIQAMTSKVAGWEMHWAQLDRTLAWRTMMKVRSLRKMAVPDSSKRGRLWFRLVHTSPATPGVATTVLPHEQPRDHVEDDGAVPSTAVSVVRSRLYDLLASGARLTFPLVLEPQVTVVIPLHNHAEQTYMTLEELLAKRSAVPYDVVVVDNGSEDETRQLLSRLENVHIITNETNLGFGAACNQGAERAQAAYVCFLNSDVMVQDGWLDALIHVMEYYPNAGAVGSKLILAGGGLQEAGSIVWADGSCLGYGRGEAPSRPEYNYVREVDFCSANGLLVRRELFSALGAFDPLYTPAYYEDVDLCMSIRTKGQVVVYAPGAEIVHAEHGTSGRERAIELQIRNRAKFLDKWRDCLVNHGMPSSNEILRRRDRRSGLRTLVVDDRVPISRLGSGFPRTRALLDVLAGAGYVISFIPTADPSCSGPAAVQLREQGIEVLYDITDVLAKIRERAGLYDVIIVSRPHNAHLIEPIRHLNPNAALIYDAEAVFTLREARQAEVEHRPLPKEAMESRIRAELAPASQADLVIAVSEIEARAIQEYHPGQPVTVWGHAVRTQPGDGDFGSRPYLAFVGYLGSAPNNDAVLQLLRSIFPSIQQNLGAPLLIVGADATEEVRAAAELEPGVRLTGFVEDLTPIYGTSRAFVAPHRFTAGIPLKVVEAMSYGVPCVVSELLAAQLGVTDGVEVLVAGDSPEYVDKITRLYQDPNLWAEIRHHALRFVHERYDMSRMAEILTYSLESVVAKKRTARTSK